MRISDWSSDVCSSDLAEIKSRGYPIGILSNGDAAMLQAMASRVATPFDNVFSSEAAGFSKPHPSVYQERKSVVEGQSVSVRVDLGGRRINKKKISTLSYFKTEQTLSMQHAVKL